MPATGKFLILTAVGGKAHAGPGAVSLRRTLRIVVSRPPRGWWPKKEARSAGPQKEIERPSAAEDVDLDRLRAFLSLLNLVLHLLILLQRAEAL